jgi:hypothetical protein
MGQYVARLQQSITDLSNAYNASFTQAGNLSSRGNIQMNGYSILGGNLLSGDTSSRAIDAIISSSSVTSTAGNVATFTDASGLVVQDSGTALSALATSASVSSTYLAKAGGVMTGALNIAATQITVGNGGNFNVNAQASGTSCVLISFFGSSASGANDIVIGAQNSATQQYAVCIGDGITSTGAKQVNLGGGDLGITNPQPNSVAIGIDQTLGAGSNGICIGNGAQIGAVSNAISIGTSANNTTASSCLIGDTAITNIRANSATCDLGTSAVPFASARLGALRLTTGANKTVGSGAVMVGGTVTVATTAVNTGDIVLVTRTAIGGTLGQAYVSAISNGTSFTITSSSGADTSTFAWVIIKQA